MSNRFKKIVNKLLQMFLKNKMLNLFNMILAFRMEVMSKSSPPVEDALQGQRIQRMKEKIAQKAFIEVILQILFAIIVFSISYVNRDERAFRLKNNIDNFLYRSTKTQFGFSMVSWKHFIINDDMSIYIQIKR